jgi:hypothetical protein
MVDKLVAEIGAKNLLEQLIDNINLATVNDNSDYLHTIIRDLRVALKNYNNRYENKSSAQKMREAVEATQLRDNKDALKRIYEKISEYAGRGGTSMFFHSLSMNDWLLAQLKCDGYKVVAHSIYLDGGKETGWTVKW